MTFTIYETSTGRIIAHAADMPTLGPSGLAYLVGAWPMGTHYIKDGVAKPYPENPDASLFVFDLASEQWRDPRGLDDLKAEKNAAINAARLKANQSHFTFSGKQIAVDPLSRSDIDATHGIVLMLQALPPAWPGGWKAMDNTYCAIPDVAAWGQFYGAMVAQGMANFARAQVLKAQLAAATTPAEVAAVPVW